MTGHTVILHGPSQRKLAHELIDKAPQGYRMTLSEPKRTTDQNAKMWAMLTDLCVQKPEGLAMTPGKWKGAIMDACGFECEWIQGIDGRPLFNGGFHSSTLTKPQMSDMIEFMYEYGARHGIVWSEPEEKD